MIAVDTQILVYAHRRDSAWHEPARACIESLATGGPRWAIPLHALVEFYAVVTRPGLYKPASTPEQALAQVDYWLEAPTVMVLSEGAPTWQLVRSMAAAAAVRGPRIYDARIAAVCLEHGVTELWTHDRDMSRFPSLRTRDPLIDVPPGRAHEPRAAYRLRGQAKRATARAGR